MEVLGTWVGPKLTMIATVRRGSQIATRRISVRKGGHRCMPNTMGPLGDNTSTVL